MLSGYADVEVGSNLKNTHYIQGPVSNLRLTTREKHAPHELLNGSFDVTAQLKGNNLQAQLKGQLEKADLKGLGLVDKAYDLQAETDISVRSNLRSVHSVRGSIDRLLLTGTGATRRWCACSLATSRSTAARGARPWRDA